MARQLALDGMDKVIREQIGRELLEYMVTQANACADNIARCDKIRNRWGGLQPEWIETDRCDNANAHAIWTSAAAHVARTCGLELRRES